MQYVTRLRTTTALPQTYTFRPRLQFSPSTAPDSTLESYQTEVKAPILASAVAAWWIWI